MMFFLSAAARHRDRRLFLGAPGSHPRPMRMWPCSEAGVAHPSKRTLAPELAFVTDTCSFIFTCLTFWGC